MTADYAVVVVTYNRLELLKECLVQIEEQTVPAKKIIVVNNASTDGTTEYLREWKGQDPGCCIITCAENTGGAGGFEKGIEAAEMEAVECILLIDDDAILQRDYMEKIMDARRRYPNYQAYAGTVMMNGEIDTTHRKNVLKPGLRMKKCSKNCYTDLNTEQPFACDIASFCGMVIDRELVWKVGLPCSEFFIWHDDTDYSIRINRYTRFLVIPDARLDHKTTAYLKKYPHRRYDWREYYGIRNWIICVKIHGSILDRAVNGIDMFWNIVFRNWLFGLVHMDHYDWKYEKQLVKEAYRDARLADIVWFGIPRFGRTRMRHIQAHTGSDDACTWKGAWLQK